MRCKATATTASAISCASSRVPRTIVGLAVGAALGLAGALIQALTRNPLADPGILGVNAGAACAIAIAIVVFDVESISGYVWFAGGGALLVTVAVYLIGAAGRGGVDPIRLTLAGVALGAVLMGITTAVMVSDAEVLHRMRVWNAGTLVNRDIDTLATIAPFLIFGLLIAACVSGPLNAIALGDDLAQSLGVSVIRTRVLVVLAVALLAGAATAVAGPISFIGLMMPHVARWIVGPDQRWIIAYTMVLTPALLLAADVVGRIVMRPGEVPIGIISGLVGAPVLIALIRRRKASGL
ncbi:iron chelate uptake ABC transporter family permease subunit [Aeromicrobium sp. UC242_57]|uniref:iron chelate uptake ABC transporter family permease subunit n=1 Tax=Aeromicrobium sp. UC242_57 TaxID=3374624 RepID=UPI0037B24BF0